MSINDEIFKAQRLPALQKFWEAVWLDKKPLKKEQTTDDDVFHYLDFGKHFPAVQFFCGAVRDKLYIQQEYVDAFEMFEGNSNSYRKGACIIGQPGIGKTCFIAYAVFERLRKKEPVAVEVTEWDSLTERYLLFTAEGVTLRRAADTDALQRYPGIWAFSDSNEYTRIPTAGFTRTPGVRTFQVTSPKQDRYKEWTKQRTVSLYVMNVPSGKDIQHLSLVLGNDVATMRSLANQWGTVTRTLLNLYDDPSARDRRERLVHQEVVDSTKDTSRTLSALNVLDTTSPDGPSTIFFIQPLCREDSVLDRQDHSIFIPTPWLHNKVVNGLLHCKGSERMKFFEHMTASTRSRATAGNVFESVVHKFLSEGKNLPVRWYKNPECPEPTVTLSLPILQTWPADVDLSVVDSPFFYWRPDSDNFPTIDGVLFTADSIYLVQTMIAMSHSFKKTDIVNFRNALPADRKALPKKFLVVGRTERQTDSVTKNLISEMRMVNMNWDVGSITMDATVLAE